MGNGKKILVAYATNSGSTAEVAQRIADTLIETGTDAVPMEISAIKDISGYDAFVVGGPMIMGWHRKAARLLRKNRRALSGKPVAIFMTAMRVTGADASIYRGTLTIDETVISPPRNPDSLTFKEKHTTPDYYIKPVLNRMGDGNPVSIGIFSGKLDYTKLKFPQMVFVMLIIGEKPGDRRNWDTIGKWAASLKERL